MNRPEKRNPLSNRLRDDLDDALAADAIHVILIKGSGRAFSSGYDLIAHDFAPKNGAIQEQIDLIRKSGQRWMQMIRNLRKRSSRRCTAIAWPAATIWPVSAI